MGPTAQLCCNWPQHYVVLASTLCCIGLNIMLYWAQHYVVLASHGLLNLKAASHDSQMLVTATYSQQMTEVISSTSSFDQLNWRRRMLHFCRRKPSAQISHDTVMDINFKILQSKYFNICETLVIKIFAQKNFKINIHQNVSRAFNILHYNTRHRILTTFSKNRIFFLHNNNYCFRQHFRTILH